MDYLPSWAGIRRTVLKRKQSKEFACAETSSSKMCSWATEQEILTWSEHKHLFSHFIFNILSPFSCSCLPLGQNTSRRGIVFDCGGPKPRLLTNTHFESGFEGSDSKWWSGEWKQADLCGLEDFVSWERFLPEDSQVDGICGQQGIAFISLDQS